MIDPTQQQPPAPAPGPLGPTAPAPAVGAPAGGGLGLMPAALSTPPRTPQTAPPPIRPMGDGITPNTDPVHLPQVRDPAEIQNIFERRGALLAMAVDEQGQRLANAMSQPPTNAVKLNDQQLASFWNYSPVSADPATANTRFWQIHDQVLAQTGDPSQAEQQAMQQVFPHRASLVGRGIASIDKQVQQADSIRKAVDGDVAPDSRVVAISHHEANQQVTGY